MMLNLLKHKPRHDINLWVIPFKMSVGAVLLFALTMIPDTLAAYHRIHLPAWFTMGGIDDARAILSAMMGCVSTVLALIFSVALLVLSMVATLFGPRLLYRFVQDWVTQATIGLFMAAFIYVYLVFLVTHQDANSSFVPQVSLITAWVLVLGAFGFLVYYSHRIAVSIQNPDAIARITDDLHSAVLSNAAPVPGFERSELKNLAEAERQMLEGSPIKAHVSGYVQQIDFEIFANAAVKNNSAIHFSFKPGQFILRGETLAVVWPSNEANTFSQLAKKHIKIGRHRVLYQDIEFGIAQIVEIGIRALSPAVNDTYTGVACVDWLGEALITLAERPQLASWYDSQGKLRLRETEMKLSRMVKAAFDLIRQSATDNPAVLIQILSVMQRVSPRLNDTEARKALTVHARAILETAKTKGLAETDLKDIEMAWDKMNRAIASHN